MSSEIPVLVFGSGTLADLAVRYFAHDSDFRVKALVVDEPESSKSKVNGITVMGFEQAISQYPPSSCGMFVAVGYSEVNRARERVINRCTEAGYNLVSYVSSHAVVIEPVEIGANCFVFENVTLQPGVRIGKGVIIWSGAFVGHHSTLEDYCFLAGHAALSGHVSVGHHAFVGTNVTIRDKVRLAPHTVAGSGANIVASTEEGGVYMSPAAQGPVCQSNSLDDI